MELLRNGFSLDILFRGPRGFAIGLSGSRNSFFLRVANFQMIPSKSSKLETLTVYVPVLVPLFPESIHVPMQWRKDDISNFYAAVTAK